MLCAPFWYFGIECPELARVVRLTSDVRDRHPSHGPRASDARQGPTTYGYGSNNTGALLLARDARSRPVGCPSRGVRWLHAGDDLPVLFDARIPTRRR